MATTSSTVRVYNNPTWGPRHLQLSNPSNNMEQIQTSTNAFFGTKKVEKGSNKKIWFKKKPRSYTHHMQDAWNQVELLPATAGAGVVASGAWGTLAYAVQPEFGISHSYKKLIFLNILQILFLVTLEQSLFFINSGQFILKWWYMIKKVRKIINVTLISKMYDIIFFGFWQISSYIWREPRLFGP